MNKKVCNMKTATAKTDSGSAVPAAKSKGTTSADNSGSQEKVYFCAHRGHGCISQQGYRCTHGPKCEPVDAQGRRFVVFHWIENGQPLATRHYLAVGSRQEGPGMNPPEISPMHVCRTVTGCCGCRPENNEGKGACGKVLGAFDPKVNACDIVGS